MKLFKTSNRNEWRSWLKENRDKEKEIYFVFPSQKANEESISYNDAVEEALCFNWIDGKAGKLDDLHSIRRFTPRNNKSSYSRFNIERLIWLNNHNLLTDEVKRDVLPIINKEFIIPIDILKEIKKNLDTYNNFLAFSDSYKRIRIDYILQAETKEERNKRLSSFINKTKENKLILGFGWDEKYYK